MAERPPEQASALQPDNLDLIPPEMEQYAATIAGLTVIRQRILWAMVQNMASENMRTDTDLAESLGISRSTIGRARLDATFQQALSVIVRDSLRGRHDELLSNIIKHGKTDWHATKFVLEYDGSYVQRSQNMNINARLDTTGGGSRSFAQIWDDMLIRAGELGWSEDRIKTLADNMVPRYKELRAEGAF